MKNRVDGAFGLIRGQAAERVPWLSRVTVRRCRAADAEHAKKWRQFMHTLCRPMAVCVAAAAEREMTLPELLGMFAHEFGHIVGEKERYPEHSRNPKTPQRVQDEANWIAKNILGIPIKYNRRTLQEISV